jgi:hypothetical protein
MDPSPEEAPTGVGVLKSHKFSQQLLTKECLEFLNFLHTKFETNRKILLLAEKRENQERLKFKPFVNSSRSHQREKERTPTLFDVTTGR